MSDFFRKRILGNLWWILAGLLGVMQVVIGHWVIVVAAGRPGPGLLLGLLLAAALVAANLALLPVLRRARSRAGPARAVARLYVAVGIATLLLGFAIVGLWVAAVPAGAVLGVLGIAPETAFALFRGASLLVVGGIAAMLAWGFTGGQALYDRTHTRVAVRGLDPQLAGLRIAQISDLHIGNGMEGRRLDALVERVNALEPDLVVITGDLFDSDPAFLEEGSRGLSALRARIGVFAVLGNHDDYTGREAVAGALARHAPALRLLRGERVRLPLAAPLYLAGVDDPGRMWSESGFDHPDLERLGAEQPGDGPSLLLVHRPEAFPRAAQLGFPLVLAGHTHGGQLALPFAASRFNLARFITRFDRGLFVEERGALYVNRGAGVAGPRLRIGTRREIAILELV